MLSKRVGALAAAMADQATAEVTFYGEQRTVSPAALRDSSALALIGLVPGCVQPC